MFEDNEYNIEQKRTILHLSRRTSSFDQFKKECKKRGIEVNFDKSRQKRIVVKIKRTECCLDNRKSRDRIFLDRMRQNVEKGIEKQKQKNLQEQKQKENSKKYDRFEQIKKNREQITKMERSQMFDNRGFSK